MFSSKHLLLVITFVYLVLFIIGFFGIYYFHSADYLINSFDVELASVALGFLCAFGVIIISILCSGFKVIEDLEKEFKVILGKLSWFSVIVIALVSGIAEEVFFRGLLQPFLGITVTSIIFGVLHFPVKRVYFIWTVFAVAMGFLLGFLYEQTGSLVAAIITHVVVNMVNLFRISNDHLAFPEHPEIASDKHL